MKKTKMGENKGGVVNLGVLNKKYTLWEEKVYVVYFYFPIPNLKFEQSKQIVTSVLKKTADINLTKQK